MIPEFLMSETKSTSENISKFQIQREVTGARSVPRVFIGGKFIGGGDDTVRLFENGELKNLLQAQGL